jgi:cytoskeletal protein RodZ
MKKLVSVMACIFICFAIQAQTQQSGKTTDKTQVEKSGETKATPAPTHQCEQHKAVEKTAPEATKAHVCPHTGTTCPKAQAAAANSQGEAKPCCAKHQEAKADEAKTEQKTGCQHQQQNADQKAKCNHGTEDKSTCPKKKEEEKVGF